jgi:peptide/nickel transport system substrate-binding protein
MSGFSVSRWSVIAIVSAALAVAACGRTAPDDEGGAPAAPTRRSATENQTKATPRDQVQDGGRLVWPIDSMPVNLNYNQIDGTEHTQSWIIRAMMPTTYTTDASGTPKWNPDYLASEPTLVTDPKQVVTFRINPKAIWYDGTPITWEDFHWQWRASNGTDRAYQISSSNGMADIESVERGADDREVVVTFRRKYADWQGIFNLFYPAATNKSPKIFNEGWRNTALTTAGPFKMGNIDLTSKTVTLVRNEKWWGNPAKLEAIVFRALDPDAHIDALANGEIDAMDVGPDVNKYNRARALTNAELRFAGGPNFRHLTINGSGPALRDVKVRQAMAMAIDRTAIARAMLGPLGIDPQPLNNHIFMANQAGYQDNSGDVGKYDPAKAAQLLDEAGWRLEGGLRKKDGRTLEIRAVIPAGVATSKQETELIQNMLGQVGMKMSINTVPTQDFFDKYVTPGQFDVTVFAWIGTAFPVSSAQSIYGKPKPGPGGELTIQQNYARIGSDEIDRLYLEATQELDRQKAIALANRIDAAIWQEVHSLTLYQRPDMWAVKTDLVNFGAFGFADYVYEDMGWIRK